MYKSTLRGFSHFRCPIENECRPITDRYNARFSRYHHVNYDTYDQIASKISSKKKIKITFSKTSIISINNQLTFIFK